MSGNGKTFIKVLMAGGSILIALALFLFVFRAPEPEPEEVGPTPDNAARLIKAYPAQKLRYAGNRIIFPDGYAIVYDDRKTKSFEEKLADGDIEDMFSAAYGLGERPDYLADGGRIRNERFFRKMYGASAAEVYKRLVVVDWFGEKVKFTSVNGAAERLREVAEELAANFPNLRPYLSSGGTFNWRKVRSGNGLSPHSYGIAIDIAISNSDYWKWKYPRASEMDRIDYSNRIPLELVRVFEKHGFIWGGRWYHYDTMHFEYRPEIAGCR